MLPMKSKLRIEVAEGTYNWNERVEITHSQANQIEIVGLGAGASINCTNLLGSNASSVGLTFGQFYPFLAILNVPLGLFQNFTINGADEEGVVDAGRLVPVRDEERDVYEHVYSPQNMTSPVRQSIAMKSLDNTNDYDGIDVQYLDLVTGEKETISCIYIRCTSSHKIVVSCIV